MGGVLEGDGYETYKKVELETKKQGGRKRVSDMKRRRLNDDGLRLLKIDRRLQSREK